MSLFSLDYENEVFVYLEIYSLSVYLEIYYYGVLVQGVRFPDVANLKLELAMDSVSAQPVQNEAFCRLPSPK